eukprot:15013989-Alexandrium_andersonii.AAC.1
MGRPDLLDAEPSSSAPLAQPLDRDSTSAFEMPRNRILARSENLDASLVNLTAQDTARQHGSRDFQSAQ